MGLWAVAFTLSAVALCAVLYDSYVMTDASKVTRIMFIACACVANWICLTHFVRDMFMFKVFVAEKMPAPLLFFKLSHEAARCDRHCPGYVCAVCVTVAFATFLEPLVMTYVAK